MSWLKKKNTTRGQLDRRSQDRDHKMGQPLEQAQGNRAPTETESQLAAFIEYADEFLSLMETTHPLYVPSPHVRMSIELLRRHFQAKRTQPSLLIEISGVPYATATRRLNELIDAGLIDKRERTRSGRSFSLHPSDRLIDTWVQLMKGSASLITEVFDQDGAEATNDRFFGSSYNKSRSAPPMSVLGQPLKLSGGLKTLIHSDPSFMVLNNLRKHFEVVLGCPVHNRNHSLDTLHEEVTKNAKRERSAYDIVAVNLPWVGELAERGQLLALDELIDIQGLNTQDFHPASWEASHWNGRCYGIPIETTCEVLMYRTDLLQDAGLLAPTTTRELLLAARALHDPRAQRYGIAWNAARGTPLGHTFIMAMADFGQPVVNLKATANGYSVAEIPQRDYQPMINTNAGLQAAKFLQELVKYSPPGILNMSWFERIKAYSEGRCAMTYSYTQMTPYFEDDKGSPARFNTGYVPHPSGGIARPVSPVGGFILSIPANLSPKRVQDVVAALETMTSARAQRLYVQNGSRGCSRYSANEDPEVREASSVIEAIDEMSRRGALQAWPRPPIPEISEITEVCGNVMHEMLRGLITPEVALERAQKEAEAIINNWKQ